LKDLTKAIVTSLLGLEGINLIKFKATIQKKNLKTTTFNRTVHEDKAGCIIRLAKWSQAISLQDPNITGLNTIGSGEK
jgi:hypothetical protein